MSLPRYAAIEMCRGDVKYILALRPNPVSVTDMPPLLSVSLHRYQVKTGYPDGSQVFSPNMSEKRLEFTERDEAGTVTATYIRSPSQTGQCRVDVIVRRYRCVLSASDSTNLLQLPKETKSPWQRLLDVFLPAGYPHSVTDDYLE